jgi:hypothetical protein
LIPSLPPHLRYLFCGHVPITSLPSLPDSLQILDCYDATSLSSLPSLPANLNYLSISFTNIATIPDLPNSLTELLCDSTQVTCLPELPNGLLSLYTAGAPLYCLPNYPSSVYSYDVNPQLYPLCSPSNNPFGCEIDQCIFGKIYHDADINCIPGPGENNITNIPVNLYQGTTLIQQTFSNTYGYAFNAPPGNYTVLIDTAGLPFDPSCIHPGLDSNFTLSAIDSVIEDVNFGLICKPGYDLGVSSIYTENGSFIPGNATVLHLHLGDAVMQYYNSACNTSGISGTVEIQIDGPVTFLNPLAGSLTPSVVGNIFTYTIPDFSIVDFQHHWMRFA